MTILNHMDVKNDFSRDFVRKKNNISHNPINYYFLLFYNLKNFINLEFVSYVYIEIYHLNMKGYSVYLETRMKTSISSKALFSNNDRQTDNILSE